MRRSATPGAVRDGHWLVGMGTAAAFRNNLLIPSGARVRLGRDGLVIVETDMTDIGTGSYTIIAQTAAEMMGVDIGKVYAACVKLREAVAQRLGFNSAEATFSDGQVMSGNRSAKLADAVREGELVAEDKIEWGGLDKSYQQSTFGAHFVEAAVDGFTGEVRIRRMLAVCAAGRILNPTTARSQVIGAMTMGAGAALMEELAVDKRRGFFVNHDLAGYEVPVHADIPHQEVIFLEEADDKVSPMKAKGVAELGICGVAAAVATAVYNATGVRVRNYPITLDKHLDRLPEVS
jgi:xanthine dehydrogenase YagR molybdenum-binding subunit